MTVHVPHDVVVIAVFVLVCAAAVGIASAVALGLYAHGMSGKSWLPWRNRRAKKTK